MSALSKARGHATETVGGTTDMGDWRWADDHKPMIGNERPCLRCGRMPLPIASETGWGVDACVGVLPGVKAACCGHGDEELAYVLFDDGTGLDGKAAIDWQALMSDRVTFNDEQAFMDALGTAVIKVTE